MTGDAAIIKAYLEVKERAEALGVELQVKPTQFVLLAGKEGLGIFFTIRDVQVYMNGLERGKRPL